MTPAEFYQLADHDPHALTRARARYDAQGITTLAHQCAAWIFRRDGVSMSPTFLRAAWLKRGLIDAQQAGLTAEVAR